ncbi:hypothetical protein [Mucilaginibacter flavidus]|uniref:putative polyvalent protein kinase domain-containing protein n=1 Tax=Mucilaginibacter flavidus TaxID=2949309 RepID=UPI0020924629|nr:hypothetical protein [Mucilaginibacter flavidus]MCO5946624.1 hypothetical protein [Mucilaginibacter flavidus]
MRDIKHELQNIILGNGPVGQPGKLKKVQAFLRANAGTGIPVEKQQYFKSEEAAALVIFAGLEKLFYEPAINENDFISEGAEQRVYRLDDLHVIKTNGGIFYESWLDYFNSLLIHNHFFPATAYQFLGFKIIDNELHAVVKQQFIVTSEPTDLSAVKQFLTYNGFWNNRNNDYVHKGLGLIFEDLHDENVLSNNGVLFFIDTIFYLKPDFYLE